MDKKLFFSAVLVIVLAFGINFVGCDDGSNNGGDTTIYDPSGTWDFTISGQSATVTITGNNWVFDGPGTTYDDTGTFTKNGNVATLSSNAWGATIGTATITSNTTMTMTLRSPSLITGTYTGTKRKI